MIFFELMGILILFFGVSVAAGVFLGRMDFSCPDWSEEDKKIIDEGNANEGDFGR